MKARKRFGQHFLAPAWADKLVEAIAPAPGDRFIEIGPGPGVLTSRLAARASHVTAVEIDRDLAAGLRREMPSNVEIVTGDFLNVYLAPYLADGPVRVAGNLPYNISSPILFRLLEIAAGADSKESAYNAEEGRRRPDLSGPAITDATVMLQREVADRLVAKPGTKDYGVLTIFTAVRADVTRMLTLPPGAFRPPPKVHSAVVRLAFKPSMVPRELGAVFEPMVRSMFTQRRKTLGNALVPFAGAGASTALRSADIDPKRRPETLTLAELVRLAQALSPEP